MSTLGRWLAGIGAAIVAAAVVGLGILVYMRDRATQLGRAAVELATRDLAREKEDAHRAIEAAINSAEVEYAAIEAKTLAEVKAEASGGDLATAFDALRGDGGGTDPGPPADPDPDTA